MTPAQLLRIAHRMRRQTPPPRDDMPPATYAVSNAVWQLAEAIEHVASEDIAEQDHPK